MKLKHLNESGNRNRSENLSIINDNSLDRFVILDSFDTPKSNYSSSMYLDIQTNEFTSLCPITCQPDFATIRIKYKPGSLCVESKSLKLYFLSFRNAKMFHEMCVKTIGDDLVKLLDPEELTVIGEFTPRGGIPFWPTYEYRKKT